MTAPPSDAHADGSPDGSRADSRADSPDATWLMAYAAGLGAAVRPGVPVGGVETPSGASVIELGDVVVKLHHRRTDRAALASRLTVVTGLAARDLFVQPLSAEPVVEPVTSRLVTAWPRVEVLAPGDEELPWAEAGALLARLHGTPLPADPGATPTQGGAERLARAVARVTSVPLGDDRDLLTPLGKRLLEELGDHTRQENPGPVSLVHGDWHLGQLGGVDGGWRLLDVDDVGLGDPTWDLGRPAGFWAAGLLDDEDWRTFVNAYRSAGGPGVLGDGDPWPRLDLAARCAVFVAAVRELGVQPTHSGISASGLLQACARM